MPRKRMSQLTTRKHYRYNKYKKPNPVNDSTNEEIPHYNWNDNIPAFFTFADDHEGEPKETVGENCTHEDNVQRSIVGMIVCQSIFLSVSPTIRSTAGDTSICVLSLHQNIYLICIYGPYY